MKTQKVPNLLDNAKQKIGLLKGLLKDANEEIDKYVAEIQREHEMRKICIERAEIAESVVWAAMGWWENDGNKEDLEQQLVEALKKFEIMNMHGGVMPDRGRFDESVKRRIDQALSEPTVPHALPPDVEKAIRAAKDVVRMWERYASKTSSDVHKWMNREETALFDALKEVK
jgi:hypothetical protein